MLDNASSVSLTECCFAFGIETNAVISLRRQSDSLDVPIESWNQFIFSYSWLVWFISRAPSVMNAVWRHLHSWWTGFILARFRLLATCPCIIMQLLISNRSIGANPGIFRMSLLCGTEAGNVVITYALLTVECYIQCGSHTFWASCLYQCVMPVVSFCWYKLEGIQ